MKTQIIAEIGNTHEGAFGLAKCIIRAAVDSGADAVKFQTHIFRAESLGHAPNPPYFNDESRQQYFDRTSFSLEQWSALRRFAEEECGVGFLSSPFSLEAVDLLEQAGLQAYKVASGEVTNHPLLIRLARTGKRVLLSSGMSSWAELDTAVAVLRDNGCRDLTLMQCTSCYPCPPEKAGVNLLGELGRKYGLPVGFSDHTLGLAVPVVAVCRGACVIEKHFTLSKRMYGPDPAFSAEPHEFRAMVDAVREAERALGSLVDKDAVAASLGTMKRTFEKSIVSARPLAAGTILTAADLAYKKPGDGLPASAFADVIGRRLLQDLEADRQLRRDMLA